MSSQQFLFVQDHAEFFNWSDSIIILNLIKDVLSEHIEEETEKYVQGLLASDKTHIPIFIAHNMNPYTSRNRMDKLKCGCRPCTSLYKRFQEDLMTSPDCSILLEKPSYTDTSEKWWILLKMISSHEGNQQQIQDCDLKQLCRIVQHCRLFEPAKNIEKVINNRNALVHSSSNELSTKTKESYLQDFEEFLDTPELKDRQKVKDAKNKIASMKISKGGMNSNNEGCTKLQENMGWQIKAIQKDVEELAEKHLEMPTLQKIMSIIKDNKLTVEQRKLVQDRREATFCQVVKMGGEDGAKALSDGGFVGKCVGGLTGGAGAFVVGTFEQK